MQSAPKAADYDTHPWLSWSQHLVPSSQAGWFQGLLGNEGPWEEFAKPERSLLFKQLTAPPPPNLHR